MTKKFLLSCIILSALALSMGVTATAASAPAPTQRVVMESATNPGTLELHFEGAQRVSFYDAWTIQVTRTDGTSWKYRPNFSQDINGKRKYLNPSFRILGKDRIGVSVSKIDESAPVLLDGKSPNA